MEPLRLLYLPGLSTSASTSAAGSGPGPGDFPLLPRKPPYCPFWRSLYTLASKTSYQLRFCWLFTLFFGRSAKRLSWVPEQVNSFPTYFVAIFLIDWVSYNNSSLLFTVLEARKSKIKAWVWFLYGEGPLPGSYLLLSCCVFTLREGSRELCGISLKGTNLIHEDSLLMT